MIKKIRVNIGDFKGCHSCKNLALPTGCKHYGNGYGRTKGETRESILIKEITNYQRRFKNHSFENIREHLECRGCNCPYYTLYKEFFIFR